MFRLNPTANGELLIINYHEENTFRIGFDFCYFLLIFD